MKPEDIITVGGQWQVLTFTQESVLYYHKITGTILTHPRAADNVIRCATKRIN